MSEVLWWFIVQAIVLVDQTWKMTCNKCKDIFITPYELAIQNIFGDQIVCIEEVSLIKLSKTQLYSISWLDKLFACLGLETLDVHHRLHKAMEQIRKAVNNSSNHSVYVVWYGNGMCILTRSVPSITPPPRPESLASLMMVLVNGTINTTPFYRQTKGYVNTNLGLVPREYAVLALICMGETDIHTLLDVLVGHDTFVTVVDGDTFEEKVYKNGDIVVL